MQYIKLIDNSKAIESTVFKEIYLSRFSYLEDTLTYLDRIGIEAEISFIGLVAGERLMTTVQVSCTDPGFKTVIEEATRSFNAAHIPAK